MPKQGSEAHAYILYVRTFVQSSLRKKNNSIFFFPTYFTFPPEKTQRHSKTILSPKNMPREKEIFIYSILDLVFFSSVTEKLFLSSSLAVLVRKRHIAPLQNFLEASTYLWLRAPLKCRTTRPVTVKDLPNKHIPHDGNQNWGKTHREYFCFFAEI